MEVAHVTKQNPIPLELGAAGRVPRRGRQGCYTEGETVLTREEGKEVLLEVIR